MKKLISYKNNIKLNYLFIFTKSFNLTNGMWLLYFALKGYSLLQIGLLESVFHVTSLIMETPTGAIADIFGRKISRILAVISYIIYIGIVLMATEYWMVILAFVLCALSYNLESGANEALVYDSLKELDKEDKFMKVQSNNEVLFQLSGGISLIVGGMIAVSNYDLVYKLMAVVMMIALVFLIFMKETTLHKRKEKLSVFKTIFKQYTNSINIILNERRLLFLIIILNSMCSLITVAFFYLQNYWKSIGFNEFEIGAFLALHALSAAIGGFFAYKLEKKIKERGILLFVPLMIVVFLWALTLSEISIIAMMLLGALDSIFYVVLSDYMNKLIESKQRATVLSFSSMVFSIFMILIFPVVGRIGDVLTLKKGFIFVASVGTLFYMIFIFGFKKYVK